MTFLLGIFRRTWAASYVMFNKLSLPLASPLDGENIVAGKVIGRGRYAAIFCNSLLFFFYFRRTPEKQTLLSHEDNEKVERRYNSGPKFLQHEQEKTAG